MAEVDWTQCPDCRWTGRTSELIEAGGEHRCPACDSVIVIE